MKHYFLTALLAVSVIFPSYAQTHRRQVVSLNGEWEIAKTGGELPDVFTSTASVPGVVDLATPALDPPDALYRDSSWYWHKRTFNLPETDFDVIRLKVYKAKYHTKVYVNGQFAGENEYCFTPSYYDIKPFLLPDGQPNEILIGVGSKTQQPEGIPNGRDSEKIKFIPGIYDNVEITLSNRPFINNIQCVPDIRNERLRVVAEIEADAPDNVRLSYSVSECSSRREVSAQSVSSRPRVENGLAVLDFEIDMKGATLWTPETPFLYELTLSTGVDNKQVRFGMRSFRFDAERKIALLNEEPYYLRGTNVCIFRFFEDPDRGTLPWDTQWTVELHKKFKDMHWNIARYCIGFPPEQWYDVCDSLGFMIQDEYPIWGDDNLKAPRIAEEYRRWMRERWNHPSVVIWDAQNETVAPEPGLAAREVRELDLSDRPWENGWAEPLSATDPVEAHPYLFLRYQIGNSEPEEGYRKELFGQVRRPDNDASDRSASTKGTGVVFPNPAVINEYGWIWLNRNGTTTTLTDRVYETLWGGSKLTSEERLHLYARHLAMLTEYWRAHRRAAGVLHFCGLGYSRPDAPRGQTSDHWIDIRNLTFEPEFYRYVKPSFSPVGLMIDNVWEKSYPPAGKLTVPVHVINDLKTTFEQDVALTVLKDGKVIATYKQPVSAKGYEVSIVNFEITLPAEAGDYLMKADITVGGEQVSSWRDLPVKSE
ncbi:MAG: hypothetical protein LBQ54_08605 [Planctomycetaceae bacterium]|jgi:hypothetical protein|nr:hypothetical protein [Planctomycetaceae bacterium]